MCDIIGAAFGVVALVLCVVFAAKRGDPFRIVSSSIYGAFCYENGYLS